MKGPVISPIFFYWLSIADEIKSAAIAISVASAIALISLAIFYFVSKYDAVSFPYLYGEESGQIAALILQFLKPLFVVLPVSIACAILIPSKATLLSMMVAKFATYENAELTVNAIREAVDYIVQAIASLK